MTVAEMTERMSAREYMQWAAYFKMERREHDKAINQVKQRAKKRVR